MGIWGLIGVLIVGYIIVWVIFEAIMEMID